MLPPSQGCADVSRLSSGSGSAVGSRAGRVTERLVGERTKSARR